ncbi:agamous-like MADS-box protein AGL62 [Impatiens glandulifera]|uniref:agamous-like MADS-box protein AGL62 n=1 Tax=Impatiens glandulifera TaxID=253017 RepID=UPI001FB0A785|nr:agamous-like MADS-box protein AGL62 [Impatiens glandulifera]
MVRTSKGRQRITMAKMQNESNLQVTFSKRRTGLFKKSSELTTLCGAEMLVIVFSPGKKVFSFGHPSVEELVARFMGTHGPSSSSMGLSHETQQLVEAHRQTNIRDLNARLMEVQEQLEAEKRRGEAITQALRAGREQRWWERSIEEMSYAQLEQLKGSLENVKAMIAQHMSEASNPLHLLAATSSINNNGGEGSSNGGFNFNRGPQPPTFGGPNPAMGRNSGYFRGGPSGYF